jgi:hypothetical protein
MCNCWECGDDVEWVATARQLREGRARGVVGPAPEFLQVSYPVEVFFVQDSPFSVLLP